MKKILFVFVLLLTLSATFAQPGKKPASQDKPPTQKEMEEMMKEMQKAMDEMSPEDKKAMDSMGIKMPTMSSIPKVSDKQLADAWEQENQLVPKKNPAKIAKIPAAPTNAALPAFIAKIHAAVNAKMTAAERSNAESIYSSIKQQPDVGTANAAISFWIQGRPMLAMYLMGKACQDAPGDINNINNYASMLTMAGAEQVAIPVLQNLNKRFPNNSTVLNNLGQAWFGLGDLDKASRYLDSAIRIYAYHSQANNTKSLIEESKGNKQGAIDALSKSIQKSHSSEKESRLRKLGKKLSGKDVDFPFKMPQDPLGLEKFNWPDYPKTVGTSQALEEQWNAFREDCNAELSKLRERMSQQEKVVAAAIQKRMQETMEAARALKPYSPLPWYAQIAALKLNYYIEDKDGGMKFRVEKSERAAAEALLVEAQMERKREADEKLLEEKYDPLIGEGRPNPLEEYCRAVNAVRNQYLGSANSLLEITQLAALSDQRRMLNDRVYYSQYINWPEEFEMIKLQAKMTWLGLIKNQLVRFQPMGPYCKKKEEPFKRSKLSEFDDVACKYHSSSDIGIMEFNNDCSRFEGKLKLGKLEYTRKIDSDDHDRLMAASLELKVGASKGVESGPVQAELTAEVRAKMEWNDKEITNWEVTSEVGVSVGSNLGHGDKSIDIAGVKAQIGMNSGSSVTGKGLLQGIDISKP